MSDPTQEYFDVQMSFSNKNPAEVFQILAEVAKLYGYDVRKTISRPNQVVGTKALVRMHQTKSIDESASLHMERAARKFVDVVSIEMERADEEAICWFTKITPVDSKVLVSAMD